MKKNVYVRKRNNTEKKIIKSFTEEIKWKAVSYYGGPKEEGKYYVSNGDGLVTDLFFKPFGQGRDLIEAHMEYRVGLEWYDRDSITPLTAEEILDLWDANGLWYSIDQHHDYDGFVNITYLISRDETIPKYFLEVDFTGPIDSEIDTYEEVIEE